MKDSGNQKSTKTKSAEEILAIAKQQGIELSEEQARELAGFVGAQGGAVGPDGELSDEALDNVAGGINVPDWLVKYGGDIAKLMSFLF